MILTKEQLDEYRSELPRSVWSKRCLTNFLDTIADLESRLKAATSKDGCKCVCHEYPEHMRMQDALGALKYHQDRLKTATDANQSVINAFTRRANEAEMKLKAATEKSDCGHPKIFWRGETKGTPIPIPEKKFRGEGQCEYCGSQIGSCAAGEFCTNKECGYVDGWYNQRQAISGHCTLCAEVQAAEKRGWDKCAEDEDRQLNIACEQAIHAELDKLGVPRCGGSIVRMNAAIAAAYARGLRDAYDYLRDYGNYEIKKAILTLKDRGA